MENSYLKRGDLITCTRCGGEVAEYYFTGYSGKWICGKPTRETKKYNTFGKMKADDISIRDITHINRSAIVQIVDKVVPDQLKCKVRRNDEDCCAFCRNFSNGFCSVFMFPIDALLPFDPKKSFCLEFDKKPTEANK